MHIRFSVNASKWQVAFIEKQDDKVSIRMYNVTNLTHMYTVARACVSICILKILQAKELIRRAKAWRNKEWPEGKLCTGRPKSYLISILVLRAYELALKQHYGGTIEQR